MSLACPFEEPICAAGPDAMDETRISFTGQGFSGDQAGAGKQPLNTAALKRLCEERRNRNFQGFGHATSLEFDENARLRPISGKITRERAMR